MAEYYHDNGVNLFESAGVISEILEEGDARKAQLASGRVSTLKRTKRKSMKIIAEDTDRIPEFQDLPPPTEETITDSSVEEILTAMSRDKENLEIQLRHMATLEEMVEMDAAHRSAVCVIGGTNQILDTFKRFLDNETLATSSCWIISSLARLPQLCETVVSAGAISLVVAAMKTHSSMAVAHAGCAALCNIGIEEQWRKQLYNNGMIESALKAMKAYPEEEWVQYTAIQALQNICNTGSLCPGVIDRGAVKTIVTAMETMSDHDDLLQSACWTFSCLAFSTNDECRARMCRQGAVEAVVRVLQASPQHKGVQFTGCSALSNFARAESILPNMVKYGCVDVLVKVCSTFSSHQGILAVTYRALVLLAVNDDAKQQMCDLDVMPLYQKTLDTVDEGPAVTEAVQLNRVLSKKEQSCCSIL